MTHFANLRLFLQKQTWLFLNFLHKALGNIPLFGFHVYERAQFAYVKTSAYYFQLFGTCFLHESKSWRCNLLKRVAMHFCLCFLDTSKVSLWNGVLKNWAAGWYFQIFQFWIQAQVFVTPFQDKSTLAGFFASLLVLSIYANWIFLFLTHQAPWWSLSSWWAMV